MASSETVAQNRAPKGAGSSSSQRPDEADGAVDQMVAEMKASSDPAYQELVGRFDPGREPLDGKEAAVMKEIRRGAIALALRIYQLTEESREQLVALRSLEEVAMWCEVSLNRWGVPESVSGFVEAEDE